MRYVDGPFVDALSGVFALTTPPRLVRSNTNLIYDCGDTFLRLTPNAFRSRDEVIRELHWLQHVAHRISDVVRVIGDTATSTRQFEFEDERFTVTRLARIDGAPIERHQWGPRHFERLGALAGALHTIGDTYIPPADLDLFEWDRIPEACLAHNIPSDARELPQLNERVLEYMLAMPRLTGRYGPIHYDIHSGSYLMTPDGRLVLFDFENSCRGHYMNDIAVVLYYARLHPFSDDDDDFTRLFLDSFWTGYATAHRIPVEEIESIPWLLLNRSLILYGYLHKIWPEPHLREQEIYIERVERSIQGTRSELNL